VGRYRIHATGRLWRHSPGCLVRSRRSDGQCAHSVRSNLPESCSRPPAEPGGEMSSCPNWPTCPQSPSARRSGSRGDSARSHAAAAHPAPEALARPSRASPVSHSPASWRTGTGPDHHRKHGWSGGRRRLRGRSSRGHFAPGLMPTNSVSALHVEACGNWIAASNATSTFGSVEALSAGSALWRPPAASLPKTVRVVVVSLVQCQSCWWRPACESLYNHAP
jgi:hypothetical protein